MNLWVDQFPIFMAQGSWPRAASDFQEDRIPPTENIQMEHKTLPNSISAYRSCDITIRWNQKMRLSFCCARTNQRSPVPQFYLYARTNQRKVCRNISMLSQIYAWIHQSINCFWLMPRKTESLRRETFRWSAKWVREHSRNALKWFPVTPALTKPKSKQCQLFF